MKVTIPYGWQPRPYQVPAWKALESGIKRAVLVWHRRAGKDLFSLNWLTKQAFLRVGLYWHMFPTYRQGRNAVWLGSTRDGRKFLDHLPLHDKGVPNQLITRKRDDEMTCWFNNGSMYQVVGSDDPDRLVGANPIGIIFSEWPLMNPAVWTLMRPILAENGGWAVFIYTPRGHNHGWDTYETAKNDPNWFCQKLTVDDTQAVPMEAIEADRREGMPPEMIEQEYFCSFDAPLVGSYYGDYLTKAREEERITLVPWLSEYPVITGWDLGYGDATAIWFVQRMPNGQIRWIDYYQNMGRGLEHYVAHVRNQDYVYDSHLFPFDVEQHELGSGKTKLQMVRRMGLKHARAVPRLPIVDGINAMRSIFPRSVFDEIKCKAGLQALSEYVKKPTGEYGPDKKPLYHDQPLHNWASHAADAARTIAVGMRPPKEKLERLAPVLPIV